MDHREARIKAQGPTRATLRERMLVEWVAQASVGDPFPEPYNYAAKPLESMVLTLVDLDVMAPPAPGAEWADIVQEATAAARAWLQRNPPEPRRPAF